MTEWVLVLWLASRPIGLPMYSYDTEPECLAAKALVEVDDPSRISCVLTEVPSSKKKRRRK